MSSVRTPRSRGTLKGRVLAIALVPSLVLLSAGVALSSYLLFNALEQRDRAELLAQGYQMAVPFMPAMSQERRASIVMVSDPTPENQAALEQARGEMDNLLAQFADVSSQVAGAMPAEAAAAIGVFVGKLPELMATREAVDSGAASRLEVYRSYTGVADAMIVAAAAIGHDSTEKDAALQRTMAADLMRISDWLDGSHALAAGALSADDLSLEELREYNRLTRSYHSALDALAARLGDQQRELAELRNSEAWAQLVAVEDALVEHGFVRTAAAAPEDVPALTLPVSMADWQRAAHDSATTLSSMGLGTLGAQAAALEKDQADTALLRSLVAAVTMLVVVGIVVLISVRLSNKLIRRLVRLRAETLRLADERLPAVVQRLRAGDRVDVKTEVPELDYGRDEIGQVAAAFNKAQQTAVAAAVAEAKTREGFNAVFLNIARRSQAIVHRQLQVLDTAERAADDPDQVELLFQLDHLTTRERRNAENLIILGGGKLGRQWRNAVSLVDLVRSAVAEAEQYTRVTVGRVPNVLVDGRAVADLVHLLAELIDNATSFSPPGARIEVRGNPAGKGVVVEVEDQGLGMERERRDTVNEMFRKPPDFGIMALSEDARIGFFVVAHLAHQHDIRVNLQESSYGGVRAGVLIPSDLIASAEPVGESERSDSDAQQVGRPAHHLVPASSERSSDTQARPTLPRRRRQANLARQLHEDPPATEAETTQPDFDQAARHSRERFSDFQRGTRRGRAEEDESER